MSQTKVSETIDLLESDEDEESEVIEILDSDTEGDIIELLGADDEDDVRIVKVVPAASNRLQQLHVIRVYVDGSYRPGGKPFTMAGGIYVADNALSIARILHGGNPDSCRAELGSIYAAVEFLSTFGLSALTGRAARAAARAVAAAQATGTGLTASSLATQSSVEVQILSDCQGCVDMLLKKNKIKQKYSGLVQSIKQLKSQLPFVVRIFKVQGHSKKNDAHAIGNKAAHNLAYKCDKHQPVCMLPS